MLYNETIHSYFSPERLQQIMSENITSAAAKTTDAAVNRAAKAAGVTAAAVSEALPTVVETVDVVTTMPAKIVLNQKLVVTASIIGGVAIGAGALWGIQKFRTRRLVSKMQKAVDETTSTDQV